MLPPIVPRFLNCIEPMMEQAWYRMPNLSHFYDFLTISAEPLISEIERAVSAARSAASSMASSVNILPVRIDSAWGLL